MAGTTACAYNYDSDICITVLSVQVQEQLSLAQQLPAVVLHLLLMSLLMGICISLRRKNASKQLQQPETCSNWHVNVRAMLLVVKQWNSTRHGKR